MGNRRFHVLTLACLATIIWCISGIQALAAEPEKQILPLRLGGSEVISINQPSFNMKVLTSDEEIVHARALKENRIYVRGKKLGYCTITVWDDTKKDVMAVIDVTVSLDLTSLKQQLHQLYPDQKIEVYPSETGVVLSGTVSGPEVVEQVLRLTQNFLPKLVESDSAQGGTGKSESGTQITNLLTVGGIQQVMLEVKMAEVNRNSFKDWQAAIGLADLNENFTGIAGVSEILSPITDGLIQSPGSLLVNFAGNPANVFVNIKDFTTALTFLETEGLARTLAEPSLVTQSGQEASFLAGGEFPIPVPQGGTSNAITIEWKEFGVALRFTPVVMSDGKISLRVAPSVSQITGTSAVPAGMEGTTFNVPNLSSRKLETTVQIQDGQTLALAGLLQDNLRESVRKVPVLGDIPILGALFRSTSYQQNKTDLLISVTPHLVKPNKEGSLRYPGENINIPNFFEFYLEGRLEGGRKGDNSSALSQHDFTVSSPIQGGLEGEFGHQPTTTP
ncbi:MAG: type II and III secretion system protein family protein [Desulfuromonadales bacterium]|nr:type II and III secretion system protein family protein [Desulfuromonadales bacterium]MDW7758142.1 type II and III secretion system protein family protein [Desulfuromonadales bacterium]